MLGIHKDDVQCEQENTNPALAEELKAAYRKLALYEARPGEEEPPGAHHAGNAHHE